MKRKEKRILPAETRREDSFSKTSPLVTTVHRTFNSAIVFWVPTVCPRDMFRILNDQEWAPTELQEWTLGGDRGRAQSPCRASMT